MKHQHNAIENSIFHAHREELKKIEKAKKVLKRNNFVVYEKKRK